MILMELRVSPNAEEKLRDSFLKGKKIETIVK
jgi:hypothetical protein